MVGMSLSSKKTNEILKYALIGGLISIPLTLLYNTYYVGGDSFTIGLVFFGGIISGYLANRASLRASAAGFYAGLIGAIPAYVIGISDIVTSATNTVSTVSSSIGVVLTALLFTVIIFAMGGITGTLGGVFGGWLTKKFGKPRRSIISN